MADPAESAPAEQPTVAEQPGAEEELLAAGQALSDEAWMRTVFRPHEAQFTVRAVFFGCVIGSVLSAANLYTGFAIGWTYGASITAAITAWVVFKSWSTVSGASHFTVLENNTMQTSASAAAAMAGAGMVNAVPALIQITGKQLTFFQLVVWLISVAFLGICFAIPLKRQLVNIENLKFPSGIAAAETTLALHGEGVGGKQKAQALFTAAGLGAVLCLVRDGLGLIAGSIPKIGLLIGKHTMAKLTFQLDLSLLNIGAGALIGLRTTLWMAVGATVCWGGLIPWAIDNGYVVPSPTAPNYFSKGAKWCMWPGVTMLVVAGLLSFALKAKSIIRALQSLKDLKGVVGETAYRKAGEPGMSPEDVEVPMKWFFWAFAGAATLCILAQYFIFEMHPLQTVLAIILSGLLALVGTRAMGETDINPIGPMGKVTQLVFAIIAPGNPQTNLMAAGVTAAGANNSGDIMQDMKTGRLLGASPRKQFWAQLFGIVTGGIFTVFVFIKAFPMELIGTKYPAPSVQTWRGMAELLTKGLSNLPPYTPQAMAIAGALAVVFTLAGAFAPDKAKKWIPSATGIGLSFVLPASNCYTFLVGAIIAEIIARKWVEIDKRYTIAVASGLIAGESVMGVAVALYTAMH